MPKREPLGVSVPFWAKRGKDNLSGFRPRDPSRSFLVSMIPVGNNLSPKRPFHLKEVFFRVLPSVSFVPSS